MKPNKKMFDRIAFISREIVNISPCPIKKTVNSTVYKACKHNSDCPKDCWNDELRDDLILSLDEKWEKHEFFITSLSIATVEMIIDTCMEFSDPMGQLRKFDL